MQAYSWVSQRKFLILNEREVNNNNVFLSSFLPPELAPVQISLFITDLEDSEINHSSSTIFIVDIEHLFASPAGSKKTALGVTCGTNCFLETLTPQD